MDKALKQRLVGASVLIALAVIVLPMLLGGLRKLSCLSSRQSSVSKHAVTLSVKQKAMARTKAPTMCIPSR